MQRKALIVDDVEINRELLANILEDDSFETVQAGNGREALDILKQQGEQLGILLLDLVMPEIGGLEVLRVMNRTGLAGHLPVIVISDEKESQKECLELGVADFIPKPFDSDIVRHRVENVFFLYDYRQHLEERVKEQTATLEQQARRLLENQINLISTLGTVVEFRNLESGEHIERVKGYTRLLAEEMMRSYPEYGLTSELVNIITVASALHDIGKITTPDAILTKPGRLTPEEFAIMKEHSANGADIIRRIKGAWDERYASIGYDICRYHHEKYDGKGYPCGLKGDEIPIAAQLVSVADCYDALVNERCYKKPFSKEKAFEMITGGECGAFSPKLMDCFRKQKKNFERLADS